VLIALPSTAKGRIGTLASQLQMLPVSVFLALDGESDNMWPAVSPRDMAGTPVAKLADWPLSSPINRLLKTAEDRLGALALLLLFGPLMLLIALAIKLDSRGPVFYRQARSGYNERPFSVFKFRTMYVAQCDATGSRQTVRGDPRVTRLGRVLRTYSLDELPQLFNALNGTMSLVGPRPHPVNMQCAGRFVSQFVDNYMARNRMRPGITGLAQIMGWRGIVDSEAHMQARLGYDLAYIDNWSIWLDLRILWNSLLKAWRDPGADWSPGKSSARGGTASDSPGDPAPGEARTGMGGE
jgi:polysaccharide biosynthesis protein PslA